jgi:hypothetical protein
MFLSTLSFVTVCLLDIVSAEAPATPTSTAVAAAKMRAVALNEGFMNYIMIICGSLTVGLLLWRGILELIKHVRTMASLNNDTQRYFAIPNHAYSNFKKHLLYAPIFRKRHNREFQISAAINVGTLPTRFQLLFLTAYLGTNVAFCVLSIDWNGDYTITLKAFRNRTGVLATVNMVSNGCAGRATSKIIDKRLTF